MSTDKEWAAPGIFLLITALMLLVALGTWDYGYYQAVRWMVCLAFAWSSFIAWHAGFRYRAFTFAAVAALFNPLAPLHFSKDTWQVLDAVTAVATIAMAWARRRKVLAPKEREDRRDGIGFVLGFAGLVVGSALTVAISRSQGLNGAGEAVLAILLAGGLCYLFFYLWQRFGFK